MNPPAKISAVLITYNEIEHIAACLQSLAFADEIVVTDSYSTDGTWEFLKSYPNIIALQHPFENFTAQKSFALQQASHSWVLFIDADERITEVLQQEIQETICSPYTCEAYYMYRQFIINNKPLRYSGLQTDKVYRLFKKEAVYFKPEKIVHEDLAVSGKTGVLKNKLPHYFYKNYGEYKRKMLLYGKLRGFEEYRKGVRPNWFRQYVKPAYKFWNHYFWRLGFLDGKNGYIISYLNALSVYERYAELRRLRGDF